MGILSKEACDRVLRAYYEKHCGIRETDVWYESSAVNVRAFRREDMIIILKCHVLTGEVSEQIEKAGE